MKNENAAQEGRQSALAIRLLFFLAGVALGLLFSPNTGRGNRAWIRQKYDSWQASRRRFQHEMIGKTEYEMGRATGLAHNLGTRLGLIREETELSDDVINQRVKTAIGENSRTAQIPRLNIDTYDGIVTIRGHVENEHLKRAAEDVAGSIKGVREVVNKITFGPVTAAE